MFFVHKILDTDYAYKQNYYGKNSVIAILDTGVDKTHIDLYKNVIYFKDYVNKRSSIYDDNGHGTHISGIICGNGAASNNKYKGIAPEAKIIALKVLDQAGNGTIDNFLKAIEWILNNHKNYNINIVNISIGMNAENHSKSELLIKAVEQLWDEGMIVITASGNSGPKKGSVTIPGIQKKIITTGMIMINNISDPIVRISDNTGRGPTSMCIMKPEIVAPGYHIISCAPGKKSYVTKSGTSMSAAIVSGCFALFKEKYSTYSNNELKLRLYDHSLKIENTNTWGMIHVRKYMEDTLC